LGTLLVAFSQETTLGVAWRNEARLFSPLAVIVIAPRQQGMLNLSNNHFTPNGIGALIGNATAALSSVTHLTLNGKCVG
jgi:hypothetical protein